MFDSMTPDQQFNLIVIAVVAVLPFIILGVVGLILEMRDRAYARGFQDMYDFALSVQDRGNRLV
jgi:hypothetical protein